MSTRVSFTPPSEPASGGGQGSPAQRRRDVLVVEDDDLVRQALKRLLVAGGHECVATASVEAAQQVLAVHEPSMVISDLNLGGRLNGIDLLCWMRTSPRLKQVPILLMTADDPEEIRPCLDAAGLADVEILSKPFDREALVRLLARLADGPSA